MHTQVTLWAVDPDALGVARQLASWLQEMKVPVGEVCEGQPEDVAARCAAGLGGPTLWVGGCGVGGQVADRVAAVVEQPLPGLEVLSYLLWYEHLGSAATRYQVAGGWKDGHLCVALPSQYDAARAVVEHLLIPEWVHRYSTEGASPTPVLVEPGGGAAETTEEDQGPWLRALNAAGATLDRSHHQGLPAAWASWAPLANVLEQAGEHASAVLPSGARVGVWGFPDLRRPGSRVLAVGEGEEWPEVVALHRYPARVGTCLTRSGGWFGGKLWTSDEACSEILGGVSPDGGATCFATDETRVYVLREGMVCAWDGRQERPEGSPKQVLARLALRWSNR